MHSGFRFQNFEILDIEGVLKIYKTQNIRTQITNFYCLLTH